MRQFSRKYLLISLAALAVALLAWASAESASPPPEVADVAQDTNPAHQTAVFAGGCFWGMDAVFRHVKGVTSVESGYAGGSAETAHYKQVSLGNTGHAESVRVRFDPQVVSYRQLLEVYFRVAHDPTQHNRQGPDTGGQYRSAIFYTSETQRQQAQTLIRQLTEAHVFSAPIVTQLTPLQAFYPAEAYHQNFYARHRYMGYIMVYDVPKIKHLRGQFPALYREN